MLSAPIKKTSLYRQMAVIFYLTFAELLTAGKNIPSRLKFLKYPLTLTPLKKKVMMGTERSRATPMLSPFLRNGPESCVAGGATIVLLPPVQRWAPSKPKE